VKFYIQKVNFTKFNFGMLLVEHQTRLSEQETNSYESYKLIFFHEKS